MLHPAIKAVSLSRNLNMHSACMLCRALKTKHETPKYGLIYHASLIGQAAPKFKGKISRVLAAKCALSIRVDALGESADATIGLDSRGKVWATSRFCTLERDFLCKYCSVKAFFNDACVQTLVRSASL